MTGLDEAGGVPLGTAALLLLVLAVTAGAGAALRGAVAYRVAAARSRRVRAIGSAWVNVPASALAAATLLVQLHLDLLPGTGPLPAVVAVLAVLGLCGGLSTWSTLALELSRSLLGSRWGDLRLQLGGVAMGLAAALFGAGSTALVLTLAS